LTPSAQAGVLQVIGTGKMSALCRACEKGLPRIVQRLLALDADPRWSDRDGNGNTPLMLAIANGHAAAADLVLSTKPEPQVAALNVQGTGAMRSALMRASEKGMAATVEKLLGLGVKVSLRDKYGKTALILAIENSHEAVAEMLLPSTAQAGALDFQGTGAMDRKSALMIASKKGLSSIVHTLLQLLADTQIKDPQGKTALDLARENGHQGCISLLEPRTSFEP
jgi:ankyrin repeat protein